MANAYIILPVGMVGANVPRELACSGVTVEEALADGVAKEPRLRPRIFRDDGGLFAGVFVNGRNVRALDGMQTQLADGDTIRIVPPISGG